MFAIQQPILMSLHTSSKKSAVSQNEYSYKKDVKGITKQTLPAHSFIPACMICLVWWWFMMVCSKNGSRTVLVFIGICFCHHLPHHMWYFPDFFIGLIWIGHVTNIPTMQFFTRISRNTQSKLKYMLSLTDCVWDFQNNALWLLINMPYCSPNNKRYEPCSILSGVLWETNNS